MFLSGTEGNMAAAHPAVSIWWLREECFLRANTHLVVREFIKNKTKQTGRFFVQLAAVPAKPKSCLYCYRSCTWLIFCDPSGRGRMQLLYSTIKGLVQTWANLLELICHCEVDVENNAKVDLLSKKARGFSVPPVFFLLIQGAAHSRRDGEQDINLFRCSSLPFPPWVVGCRGASSLLLPLGEEETDFGGSHTKWVSYTSHWCVRYCESSSEFTTLHATGSVSKVPKKPTEYSTLASPTCTVRCDEPLHRISYQLCHKLTTLDKWLHPV